MRRFLPLTQLLIAACLGVVACGGEGKDVVAPCAQEDSNPVITHWEEVVYSEIALLAQIEGTVITRVLVGADGTPEHVQVIQSVHPLVNVAAIEAAWLCEFDPAIKDCESVSAWMALPFNFRIEEKAKKY